MRRKYARECTQSYYYVFICMCGYVYLCTCILLLYSAYIFVYNMVRTLIVQWNKPLCKGHRWYLAVLYREVYLIQRYMWLGLQTVSSLERCPYRVSLIERF